MTPTNRDVPAAEKTFLKQSPRRKEGLNRDGLNGRDEFENPVPRPAVDTTVLDTVQTWQQYCALSIKVDLAVGLNVDQQMDDTLMILLDQAKSQYQAVGCRWAEGLYFCALKDADSEAAERFSRQLQEELGRLRPETVTIGIAPFPQLNFSRGQSMANTCKALDHAAFFGPGSVVCFDATSLNISGDKFYRDGELTLAADEYRIGLALNPRDANIHNSLGICHARQGDLAAATRSFEAALDIQPQESMALYNLGMVAMLQENSAKALAQFKAAYTHNPKTYEIPYQIGVLLTEAGQWHEALAYLDEAIELNDTHWRLFNLRGDCLAQTGDIEQAVQAYKRSVKINPNDADSLSALGCLYGELGENPGICEAFLMQSISLNPESGLFHYRLGRWHQKHRNTDLALAAFEQASALGYDASQAIEALDATDENADGQTIRCA